VPAIVLTLIIPIGLLLTGLQLVSSSYKSWVMQTHYVYYFTRALFALAIIAIIILIMEYIEKESTKVHSLLCSALGYLGGITLEIYLLHQSYMIIFGYPYHIALYLLVAAILPLITACIWNTLRQKMNERRN